MQKPDDQGCITVQWPSRNIPHGGIFHTRVANPTEGQRELLKVLLEESKLTIEQRRKNALALREAEDKPPKHPPRARPQLVRPRTSRRRSLSEIRQSGIFESDRYLPIKRGEDRELLKERLANSMTYGDTEEPPKPKVPLPTKKPPKLPTNKEIWNDLVTQIRERTDWLAEMEYLGQAGPHRDIIKDQIAERMRALDALGIDSECSTSRSTATGFSTIRSREPLPSGSRKGPKVDSANSSVRSGKGGRKSSIPSVRGRERIREENVAAYAALTPLQQSPRRRQ